MITPADIAKNRAKLNGEVPNGRLFDENGKELNPPARPPQWRQAQHDAAVAESFVDFIRGKP